MKIGTCLKLALFAFLCSIVCTIGYILTEIELIAILVNWLWLATYIFLVAWLCTKVYRKIRYSINLIFVISSFAITTYLAIQLSLQDSWAIVNDLENMTLLSLMFVVFTIICLLSVMSLIGRLIFGKPLKNVTETPVMPIIDDRISTIAEDTVWVCSCGYSNNGSYCSRCCAAKPKVFNVENNHT